MVDEFVAHLMAVLPVSVEELERNRIHPKYWDSCVHLLIDLNKCRYDTMSMPWKCGTERHAYEKCEHEE
jgi:NADH dehydrogenase (ubiquinone) 1 beta subcomplex subunit 7